MTYYNENDPKAAAWLRELIHAGEIPKGDVDERSILDVKPYELVRYSHQHFFAGIGGWAFALRIAGWPDNLPVRTGSCPCQPFSQAGKGKAEKDERHLWPAFRDVITFGEPTITFGEQVASPLGRIWLSRVRADLEGLGYEVGAADLCAAGVGSPHIRQRLYWMAHAGHSRRRPSGQPGQENQDSGELGNGGEINGVVLSNGAGRNSWKSTGTSERHRNSVKPASGADGMGHADSPGSQGRNEFIFECSYQWPLGTPNLAVFCQDQKYRRFEPGSFPLANGVSNRMGLLRGYGNAIVPQVAAEFIQACVECLEIKPHLSLRNDETLPVSLPSHRSLPPNP